MENILTMRKDREKIRRVTILTDTGLICLKGSWQMRNLSSGLMDTYLIVS